MSDLRDQLLSAQLGYHAPIYPDDLATQLLPPKRVIWPRIVATLTGWVTMEGGDDSMASWATELVMAPNSLDRTRSYRPAVRS